MQVSNWHTRGPWILASLLLATACGRYFHTPLQPSRQQSEGMAVNDDGSITYTLDRLGITLRPMTDAELNRLVSPPDGNSVNPYTFGDLILPGEDWTPPRFTVFRLQVANYQYPKVKLDPLKSHISSANHREYDILSFAQLYDYYRSYWQGLTGQGRSEFRSRTDLLRRTMYTGATIFSGNDEEGYLVFPLLDDDVRQIQVDITDIAVHFDYADQPVETIDLSFNFERDIRRGFTPADAVRLD